MSTPLDRRNFLRLASAAAALAQNSSAQSSQAQMHLPEDTPISPVAPRAAVKNRKNFVGIQVRGFAWVDEGVDQVLDNLQNKGEVNTVWAYTFAYGEQRLRRAAASPTTATRSPPPIPESTPAPSTTTTPEILPEHHRQGLPPHRLRQVQRHRSRRPKAKARGMDFFAWDLNNPQPHAGPHRAQLCRARRSRPQRPPPPTPASTIPTTAPTSAARFEPADRLSRTRRRHRLGLRARRPARQPALGRRQRHLLLPVLPRESPRPRHLRPARAGRLPRDRPALPHSARAGPRRLLLHLLASAPQAIPKSSPGKPSGPTASRARRPSSTASPNPSRPPSPSAST
jgi:hypothetical protein